MATLMLVPEVAAGATESVLSEWLVAENIPFQAGDPILVLETDKAVVEVVAEVASVILRTLVPVGSTVEVGAPIALVGEESERGSDLEKILTELGVSSTIDTQPALPPQAQQPAGQTAKLASTAPTSALPREINAAEQDRIFSSPIARKLLQDAGLSVETVAGSGPNGRIVRRDVEQAIAARAAVPAAIEPLANDLEDPRQPSEANPVVGGPSYLEIPHSRQRRALARRLTQSKQSIPHFYVKRTARIDDLLALRLQLNDMAARKLSINDLVIRAVAAAFVAVPEANVIWTDEGMRQFDSVDIAVAIASERGLVTPVLRSVEKTSIGEVANAVRSFVQQANDGKLQQRDLEGGSITVTNLGMYGVEEFSAIINPPQSAILAVGAGTAVAAVVDGEVVVATTISLVLSVDHRAIDGALAARWIDALVHCIERPLRLLT